MELKDVILSTLAEMEETPLKPVSDFEVKETIKPQKEQFSNKIETQTQSLVNELQNSNPDNELMFLSSIRERLLVLFEGFQAPNNTNIEAKVDMTLNFLEYVLVSIDSRIQNIEKGSKS